MSTLGLGLALAKCAGNSIIRNSIPGRFATLLLVLPISGCWFKSWVRIFALIASLSILNAEGGGFCRRPWFLNHNSLKSIQVSQSIDGNSLLGRSIFFNLENEMQAQVFIQYFSSLHPDRSEAEIRRRFGIQANSFPVTVSLARILPDHVQSSDYFANQIMNCHASAATFHRHAVFEAYLGQARANQDAGLEDQGSYDNPDALSSIRTMNPRTKWKRPINIHGFEVEGFERRNSSLRPGDSISIFTNVPDAGWATHEVTYLGFGLVFSKPVPRPGRIVSLVEELTLWGDRYSWPLRLTIVERN